jgi:predicted nucleic acid-binding protein
VIVVSDTTCLNYLARLGLQSVLPGLFRQVLVPPAVATELAAGLAAHAELDQLLHAPWLEIRTLRDNTMVVSLANQLDLGEAEAITLANELTAILLMDDLPGRKCAAAMNLHVIGTFGVLAAATQKGMVPRLKPVLDRLVNELGFRASEDLIRKTLDTVGE